MNIFDAHISGSLSVSSSAEISGDLRVLGITSGSFSGSFKGDGSQIENIPASGVTGLNLTQISDGSATASISQANGFNVNTNINVSGSILPSVNVGESISTYDLGSATNAWHHLYISTGSIKFVNDEGEEQGRITINPNSGQFNILNTSGLTQSDIDQIELGNVPSSSLSDINIKSLNIYDSIDAGGSVTASFISGSFLGNGEGLYNIPASGVTGLNLTQIADGSATASISNTNGLRVNSNTEITGALKINNINLGSDNIITTQITDGGGKYFIDGTRNPKLSFVRGFTYRFYYDNNNTHPFEFSITNDGEHNGGVPYTEGVTTNVSPFYIQIEVTDSTPNTLYYFCDHHIAMGNIINVSNDVLNNQVDSSLIFIEPSTIATTGSNNFTGNQNISGSLGVTGSVQISGSISLNGQAIGTGKLDETTFNSYATSSNDRLNDVETSTGSLNTFTSSIDTTIKNKLDIESVISGSVQVNFTGTTGYSTFSSSVSTSIASLSSSVATTTIDLKNRVDSIETSTGSLNSFTGSINTTIKDKMNADGVLSGSITFDISTVPGFSGLTESVSGSISSSVNQLSGSLTLTVTNLSSSLTNTDENQNNRIVNLETASSSLNTFTSSINTTIKSKLNTENVISGSIQVNITETTGYSTFSSSIATTDLNQNNRLTSIENSYATTGSNIFQGSQTITGSLYVSQDLIVAGSSSIQHISSSIVNIADNIITVNAQNPSVRFGGLAVIDSGSSPQVSGSMLFDSVNDQWLFVHQNQSTITSSVLLIGPQTYDNLGNETYPTTNRILKSLNAEHVGDSNITDTGTKVSINSNTEVTGTLKVTGNITSPNITAIETSTGSLNTFTSSILAAVELTGSNLTIKGNLIVKGTTTNVNTTTLDVDNNLINLNGTGATSAGLRVKDTTGPNQISGSLLWDSTNDYWIAGQLGSEQRLVRETEFNTLGTRVNNVETSTGSLNSFTSSINTTIKNKLNSDGVISGSSQINHNATTNYDANQHVDHTTVSVSAGSGLSGGGTIAATRTLTLDTGSVHFLDGVKKELNTEGVISGSAQVTGIGNSQLTNSSITIGSTATSLGGTSTSLVGLTSVTSTAFTGSLQGNASNIIATSNTTLTSLSNLNTVGTITGGTWNGTSISTTYTAAKVTSVNAGTGVGVDTTTGAVTVSIGQSVATTATPTFGSTTINGNLIVTGVTYSSASTTIQGAGPYDWFNVGRGSIATSLWIKDITGAGWALMGGSYSLSFKKDVSGTSWVTAMTLTATSSGDTTPNVSITNNLSIGGSITSGTWNGTAIANNYLANSSFHVGTTSISLGRGSASQTLTGVSIDGNAATVTNGVYTTGDQTIGGTKTFSNKIIVGTFPNSTTNTGEAWLGRASDRNSGTMTVQLGGNSATNRQFEVVDYAWSVVLFAINSNGTATVNNSTVKTLANSSYSTTFSSVTSLTVTHNLGTKDVAVFVYDSSDNMFWPSAIVTTSTSVVTITFASSRSGRVVVVR